MKANATIESWDDQCERFRAMTAAELDAEFDRCLGVTAEAFWRLACLVKVMEERGHDLSGKPTRLLRILRQIANGRLLAESAVRFLPRPDVLNRVAELPLTLQKQLSEGQPVKLVTFVDGKPTHLMADPLKMTRQQLALVFDKDGLRDEAEQLLKIDHDRKRASRPLPDMIGAMRLDKDRGGVTVGRKWIPVADLKKALRALGE